MDGCEYNRGGSTMNGLVQYIIRSSRHRTCEFVIIFCLITSASFAGNSAPTAMYNHGYYSYGRNEIGSLQIDLVIARHIQYPMFFVSDPCNGTTHFGDPYTNCHKFETEEQRMIPRLFRVASVRLTSFREVLTFVDNN